MTISIPVEKLKEVVEEFGLWFDKKWVTKSMVQSLVGRLSHIANCVLPREEIPGRDAWNP